MTKPTSTVTFWFDPVCPYTWTTSRWLRSTAPRQGDTVRWQLMSLGILNEGREIPEEYRDGLARAVGLRRVLVAAGRSAGQDGLERLYTAVGERVHERDEPLGPDLIRAALADVDLPERLADAATDESLDEEIRASHEASQASVGDEAGSPIVAIGDGPGFFGPVVISVPDGAEADRLYEAVRLVSSVPQFSELKRARHAS